MKVSGFTIVRNALKFDYPVVEAITSILDCVDEMIVAVGNSEDETLVLIKSIPSPKIKIIETQWDDNLRTGGLVLSLETNKALAAISADTDWCFYIQADEVMHEKYKAIVVENMTRYKDDLKVEGLLFNYTHFYGSYQYIGDSRSWYRKEIRIIRNLQSISSYKDAQGFRLNNRKLNVKLIDAHIYHYGWVRNPIFQQEKQKNFHKHWHEDKWLEENINQADEYDYEKIDSLKLFTGTHPLVMNDRIQRLNWRFEFDTKRKKLNLKKRLLQWFEHLTGWRLFEYKNYNQL